MNPLTEEAVRASFVNASKSERARAAMPDLSAIVWTKLDYLGWRDKKQPQVGYLVAIVDEEPVGLMLKQAEARPRSRAQCTWCSDVTLPNDVVLFATKRAGDAGRRGDTVATLLCANFECSKNVRALPPLAYPGFDREAARVRRIASLQASAEAFARDVRDT